MVKLKEIVVEEKWKNWEGGVDISQDGDYEYLDNAKIREYAAEMKRQRARAEEEGYSLNYREKYKEDRYPGVMGALKSFWNNYADFSGKASLRQYWFAIIPITLIQVLLGVGIVLTTTFDSTPTLLIIVWVVFGLVVFVPTLSLTSRRLADAGFSRWLTLLMFTPLSVVVFVLMFFPTAYRPNFS